MTKASGCAPLLHPATDASHALSPVAWGFGLVQQVQPSQRCVPLSRLSTAAPAGLSVTRMGRRWEPSSSRSDDARRLLPAELLTWRRA